MWLTPRCYRDGWARTGERHLEGKNRPLTVGRCSAAESRGKEWKMGSCGITRGYAIDGASALSENCSRKKNCWLHFVWEKKGIFVVCGIWQAVNKKAAKFCTFAICDVISRRRTFWLFLFFFATSDGINGWFRHRADTMDGNGDSPPGRIFIFRADERLVKPRQISWPQTFWTWWSFSSCCLSIAIGTSQGRLKSMSSTSKRTVGYRLNNSCQQCQWWYRQRLAFVRPLKHLHLATRCKAGQWFT